MMIYLQAIELSSLSTSKVSTRFYSLDAKECLDKLLNIVENTASMEEAYQLLEPSIEKKYETWIKLAAIMYKNTVKGSAGGDDKECRYEEMPHAFWLLSHGQYQDILNFNSTNE